MKEKWLCDIQGLEHLTGYKITNDGTITSYLKRCSGSYGFYVSDTPQRILKPEIARNKKRKKQDGYLKLNLRSKQYSVHQLVALAFIPNPENKTQVNHKDGDKIHCHELNLEWATNSENIIHAIKLGLQYVPKGDNHYSKKLIGKHYGNKKVSQHDLRGNFIKSYASIEQASKETGIGRTNLSKHLKRVSKSSGGYLWFYGDWS
jgi:hypothetical protein